MRFQTPLGLFSVLWALAACLHHLEAQPLAGLPLYPFALLLLWFPERLWAIATFAIVHAALLSLGLPAPANHSVLALLVDACLLIGCAAALRSARRERGRRLWESVRGPMQATLAVVYAFTVFDKLNSSFLDPEVSCAGVQLAKMFSLHGLELPAAVRSAYAFNIYFTLVVETAIVLLLLWPRCTYLGAMTGLLFHTGLAWAQFFDFSSVVLALYLFCLPWERLQLDIRRIPRWARVSFSVGLVALFATSFYFLGFRGSALIATFPHWRFRSDTLMCLFWTLMTWPILLPLFWHGMMTPVARRWTGTPLAWVIPLIAFLNGTTSYIGLKTVSNYSMFSNLRTEGGHTNHLLVPAGRFFVADHQNDLVRVWRIDGEAPAEWPWWVRLEGGPRWMRRNIRWLAEGPGARVPFAELRRTVQLWSAVGITEIAVVYERGGERHQLDDAGEDPELARPMPLWERKLMAFRGVPADGRESACRW